MQIEKKNLICLIFFKVIGMEKLRERQSKLKFTEDISICHSTINQAGMLPELDNLQTLCLQSSCLSSWKTVNEIVTQIPSLKNLDLRSNRLQLPESDEHFQFPNLETLIVNACGISEWSDVLAIARICPNLREFSLKQNDIRQISENSAEAFKKLEVLILSENLIEDFEEVLKLKDVPKLKEILVNNNKIKNVKLPDCDHNERLSNTFRNLETINLRYNEIENEMEMFNELDKLPALTRLSYINEKASEGNENEIMDIFMMAVGMIEKLVAFNRSEIEKIHRNDAMYEMWKKFAPEWLQIGSEGDQKINEFNKKRRCYPRLLLKYGNPDQFILQPQIKRVTSIEIQFKNVVNGKMYHKKVPIAMTVRSLVGLVYKIAALHTCTGMDLKSIKLYYIDAYNNNIKVYLDNLSKSLDYYSLQNGDTIYIDK